MKTPLAIRWGAGAAALGLFLSVHPSGARAESIAGRTSLQLQTAVLGYRSVDTHVVVDGVKGDDVTNETFGLGILPRTGFAVGHAWGEHFAIHILGALSVEDDTVSGPDGEEPQASLVSFSALPTLRFIAGQGKARFYVGGGLGLSTTSQEQNDVGTTSMTSIEPTLTLGLHAFITERVSLDPGFELAGMVLNGSQELEGTGLASNPSVDIEGSGVRLLFTLGLSGWLGGDDEDERDAAEAGSDDGRWRSEAVSVTNQVEPPTRTPTVFVQVSLPGMNVLLAGEPEQDGQSMTLTMEHLVRAAEWRNCPVELVTAEQSTALRPEYKLRRFGSSGFEEKLAVSLSPSDAKGWLASDAASIKVCDRHYPVTGYNRNRLALGLRRFQDISVRAGTAEPEAPVEPTPSEAPSASEAPSVSEPVEPTAPAADQEPTAPPTTTP